MSAVEKTRRNDRLILLIGFLIFLLLSVSNSASGFFSLTIYRQFRLSVSESESWWIWGIVGHFLGSMLAGRMFPRMGAGTMMLVGSIFVALAALGNIVLTSWSVVVPLALLYFLGTGMVYASLHIFFVGYFSARIIIWLHAALAVGTMTFRHLFLEYVYSANWQTISLIILVIYLIIMILCILIRKRWRVPDSDDLTYSVKLIQVMKAPMIWIGFGLFAVMGGIQASGSTVWPTILASVTGKISPSVIDFWIGAIQIATPLGLFLLGVIIPWLGTRWLLRLCMVAALIGSVIVGQNPTTALNFLGYVLIAVPIPALLPLLLIHTRETVFPAYLPTVIGLQLAISGLVNYGITKLYVDHFELQPGIIPTIICLALLWVVLELANWLSRPQKKKQLPDRLVNDSAPV